MDSAGDKGYGFRLLLTLLLFSACILSGICFARFRWKRKNSIFTFAVIVNCIAEPSYVFNLLEPDISKPVESQVRRAKTQEYPSDSESFLSVL